LRRASVVAALLCGCAGSGIDLAQLPARPIAIVHRTLYESEQRSDLLLRSQGAGSAPGRVRLEDVGQLLGIGADEQARRAALLGHLSLVHPKSGRIERVEAALPGERPLCWSSDADRLLFVSFARAARPQLFEYSRSSQEIRALTRGPAAHPFGCYGPGDRLVVSRVEAQGKRLVSRLVVHAPPGAPKVITGGPADSKPVWSPDGGLIAYETVGPGGGVSIAVVDPEGGEGRVLTPGHDPVFTPDGKWIVFSAPRRGRDRLWRIRPDGLGRSQLGESVYDERDPAVSPDGRYVLFVGEQEDTVVQKILVRPFSGGGQRPLLDREEGMSPTW
jgi:dipeptidyl aminopeptidase/acylaminoacyl peptidase